MSPNSMVRRRSGLYIPRTTISYDDAVLADSPQMYLKLADAVGTTNPVVDSSGNSRPGNVTNTVTFGSAALVTGDAQTSMQVLSAGAGRVTRVRDAWMATPSEWTVDFILKPTSLPSQATYVGLDDNGTNLKWRLESNATGVFFVEWKETGGTYRSLGTAAGALVAGTKKHLAFTYKVGGGCFLYVNGVQAASSGITQTTLFDSSSGIFNIGALAGPILPMNGLIGRVALYTTQLSAARIAVHAALI